MTRAAGAEKFSDFVNLLVGPASANWDRVALTVSKSICLLLAWTGFLIAFWALGIPLGIGSNYDYLGR